MTDHARVALSISDSPPAELVRRGLSPEHLQICYLEMSRHLLSAGYDIAYGGYLDEGYATRLLDLLRAYQRTAQATLDTRRRCHVYLAAYLYDPGAKDENLRKAIARAKNVGTVTRCPHDAPSSDFTTPDVEKALQLTEMRRAQTAETAARVALGGQISKTAGRAPGVIEECYLSLAAGQPLLLIGGFGGAAGVVADAIRDVDSPERASVLADPLYRERAVEWQGRFDPPSVESMLGAFEGLSSSALPNGLSAEENMTLMTTDDIDEIVTLVMRSLHRLPVL